MASWQGARRGTAATDVGGAAGAPRGARRISAAGARAAWSPAETRGSLSRGLLLLVGGGATSGLDLGLLVELRRFVRRRGGDAALADQEEDRGDEQNGRDDDGEDDGERAGAGAGAGLT